MITTNKLTSGYYGGETDAVKPNDTKCTHGGPGDSEALDPYVYGNAFGINKDTKLCLISPHHDQHDQAVELATEHTKSFILSLRDTLGEENFRTLLGVNLSMGIAVDVSGSMKDIIEDVGDSLYEALKDRSRPGKLILAPFSEMDLAGYTSTDPSQFLAQFKQHTMTSAGGDCAERSMAGSLNALWSSETGGVVFVLTDADAKDIELIPRVIQVASARKVQLHPIIFTPTDCPLESQAYQQIAEQTGGSVHYVARAEAGRLAGKMNTFLRQAGLSSITSTAASKSINKAAGFTHPFVVDSTISAITVVVTGQPDTQLVLPSGLPVREAEAGATITVLSTEMIFEIARPMPGTWRVESSASPTNVRVTTDSTLQLISLNFVEQRGRAGHQGFFTIHGSPLASQPQRVIAWLSEPVRVPQLELRSLQGELLASSALTPLPGPDGKPKEDGEYITTISPPDSPFIAHIAGSTEQGEPFVRSTLRAIRPQFVHIESKPVRDAYPGETRAFEFVVTNTGAADKFAIRASDEAGYVQPAVQQDLTLASGESAPVSISVHVPATAKPGTSISLLLYVESTSSKRSTQAVVAAEIQADLDRDRDRTFDDFDNCPMTANLDQADADGDGTGDACDATPGTKNEVHGCTATGGQAVQNLFVTLATLAAALAWRRSRSR